MREDFGRRSDAYEKSNDLCTPDRGSPSLREPVPPLSDDDKAREQAARMLIEQVVAANMAPGKYALATETGRP